MNIIKSSYKETLVGFIKKKFQEIKKKKSFLMLSNNVDYCNFLTEEFKKLAASTWTLTQQAMYNH